MELNPRAHGLILGPHVPKDNVSKVLDSVKLHGRTNYDLREIRVVQSTEPFNVLMDNLNETMKSRKDQLESSWCRNYLEFNSDIRTRVARGFNQFTLKDYMPVLIVGIEEDVESSYMKEAIIDRLEDFANVGIFFIAK